MTPALSDVFAAIAHKRLVQVDLPNKGSNQHELNASTALREFFNTGETLKAPITWHLFQDDQEPLLEIGDLTFYDARAKANGGAGIWHVERDPTTGEDVRTAKRLHDLRGTFATRLMTEAAKPLTDRDIANVMGWSEQQVGEIRKHYVDDKAIVVALTRRLGQGVL